MTQVLVHDFQKVFLKPIMTNQWILKTAIRFLRVNSGPAIQGRRPAFLCRPLAGLADTCGSVANANRSVWIRCGECRRKISKICRGINAAMRVWDVHKYGNDFYIAMMNTSRWNGFCLISGHAEDWDKLFLGINMKIQIKSSLSLRADLFDTCILRVILLPFIGHFRPILFQVSSRWYVASSRAAGSSARCTPCTDPRPAVFFW